MGELYSQLMLNIERPRVGGLSVGEEDAKGNDLTKHAFRILSKMPINFIGNVEGHDIFNGHCDVIICDGFVGNVMLKSCEGLARATFHWMKQAFKKNAVRFAGALLAKEAFHDLKQISDSEEFGGAPLMGIKGVCIIGHGASSPKAAKNAIRMADTFLKLGLNDKIVQRVHESGIDTPNGTLLAESVEKK